MDKKIKKKFVNMIASLDIAVIDVLRENSKDMIDIAKSNVNLIVSIAMESSMTIMKTVTSEETSDLEICEALEAYIKAYKETLQKGGNS